MVFLLLNILLILFIISWSSISSIHKGYPQYSQSIFDDPIIYPFYKFYKPFYEIFNNNSGLLNIYLYYSCHQSSYCALCTFGHFLTQYRTIMQDKSLYLLALSHFSYKNQKSQLFFLNYSIWINSTKRPCGCLWVFFLMFYKIFIKF